MLSSLVEAESCGMNLRRKADLAAIKAESQLPEPAELIPICSPQMVEATQSEGLILLDRVKVNFVFFVRSELRC